MQKSTLCLQVIIGFRIDLLDDSMVEVLVGEKRRPDDHRQANSQDHSHEAAIDDGVKAIALSSLGSPPFFPRDVGIRIRDRLSDQFVAERILEGVETMAQTRHRFGADPFTTDKERESLIVNDKKAFTWDVYSMN